MPREFVSIATVEGSKSRDTGMFRLLEPGSVYADELPFSLLDNHERDNASVIGRVDSLYPMSEAPAELRDRVLEESPNLRYTDPQTVWLSEGVFADTEEGNRYADLVDQRMIRWVSVGAGNAEYSTEFNEETDEVEFRFSQFQVVELSLCPVGAIGPCRIWTKEADKIESAYDGLTASAVLEKHGIETRYPVRPKDKYFTVDSLPNRMPSHATVTEDGHFYAYLAPFDTAHVGQTGVYKTVPKEERHDFFHKKAVITESGKTVSVGTVTFGGEHADLRLDPEATRKHYDNTSTVFADVVVVEHAGGYVLTGAVRPNVTESDVREVMGANFSGDWRVDNNGDLRLRHVLAVNMPGFDPAEALPRLRFSAVTSFGSEPKLEAMIHSFSLNTEAPVEEVKKVKQDKVETLEQEIVDLTTENKRLRLELLSVKYEKNRNSGEAG